MNPLHRIHDAWVNTHPLWRLLAVLLVLVGGLFVVFGPVKSIYRGWKSSDNLISAKEALAAGRFFEARNLSFQILRQNENAFEPLPILLRSTIALKDPLAVRIAVALLKDDRTLPNDHLLAWTYLCQSGPSYLPLNIWPLLPEEKKYSPDFQLPLIDRMMVDRMLPAAAAIIAASPEPYSVELHCRLLVMLAKTATDEAYAEFHRSLVTQLRATPDAWPRLLEVIDEIPQSELTSDIHNALPESAIPATSLTPENALRIIRCEMAAHPEKSDELIQSAFKRYQTSEPIALARWCLQIGRPDEAAKCIDLEEPAEDPGLYRLQIEILEAAGESEKLATFLASAPVEVPSWETLVQLAAIALSADDKDLAAKSIKDALKSAIESADPAALVHLAREAQDRQLDDLALDAWTNAIARATGPLPPSQSIAFVINELSIKRREDELYAILSSLRFIEVGNQVILAQHLYLACLSGRAEPRAVIEELTPLQKQFPAKIALRCILAIAHVLSGEIQEADDLTSDPGIDWSATSPAHRAIRGLVLAKTNRTEEAQAYFEDFPWDELLPSEKRVYQSLVDGVL